MAKKQKFYVVWIGQDPGVYKTWAECFAQVKGYQGAKYKSFSTLAAAEEAYYGDFHSYIGQGATQTTKKTISEEARKEIIWESMAVDAACSGNPGNMEYRGVDTSSGIEFFRMGPFRQGTNNVGEFLALVHGLAYLKKKGKNTPIYSDSKIAMGWITRKKAATKLKRVAANAKLFELIQRGELWLRNNTFDNKIMKWKTKEWGEIPADFGRK